MTPAENFATSSAGVVDTSGKHGNNIRLLIPYSELEGKKLSMLTQRCQKEIMKTFLIEDFFHLPPVSLTPVVVHLELRISPRIYEKI
jgi:hypothetical protein